MANVKMRGDGIEITDAVLGYANKKVEVFEKYIKEGDTEFFVEVSKTTAHHKQGDVFRAEFDVTIEGKQFRSEAEGNDLYAAIDEAKDELLKEIRNAKDKGDTLFKRGARKIKSLLRFGKE